jgi:hypothetical protein
MSRIFTWNEVIIIPWRGNLSFRVYSPDKPVKYGIKAYMVSDSSNGYVSKFKLYTGKFTTISELVVLMFEVFRDGFVEQFQ